MYAQQKPKPFTWSWSRLKNFRTCPKRHWHVDIQKDFKEAESDALTWGNEVHDAMAKRIAKDVQLPRTMEHYEEWPQRITALKKAGYKTLVENKLAMNKDYRPRAFFDGDVWFRGVLDVITLLPQQRAALVFDWKTGGQIKPDFEQLGLFAQLVFAHYEEIDQVASIYVWTGHDDYTLKVYKRDGMLPLWNDLNPELAAMLEAWRTTTYPPKPSGLCKHYCPVESCPYHGKGTH